MPWKTSSLKEQRHRFITLYLRRQKPLIGLCEEWSISRQTAYKWLARYAAEGRAGLSDRTHAAACVHNRPALRWLARIRRWRWRHPRWGAPKLHGALRSRFGAKGLPSEAAIGRWLKTWQLTHQKTRRRSQGPTRIRPELTQARRPNQVWTVDFKGWFRTGDGRRVDPLTVRDLASRFILAVILQTGNTLAETRRSFAKLFGERGLPQIIRCDNGTPFGSSGALGLTRLSAWWVKLGIRVEFIEPGRPDQNGAHEQLHRVYKDETLQPPARTVAAQKRRTRAWIKTYNHERPHEALGLQVPASYQ
jgi:putative transposase